MTLFQITASETEDADQLRPEETEEFFVSDFTPIDAEDLHYEKPSILHQLYER